MKQACQIAIIGAGPYGLSLAAHLSARGIENRIFGRPMDTWASHMPRNMTLKSEGFASSLSGPSADSSIKSWCAKKGIPFADQWIPIGIDNFLAYANDFRARFVPHVENVQVTSLERASEGFVLTLDTGERVLARQVVMAVGVTWFAHTPEALSMLPANLASHSYAHRDVEQFRNREVAIIGAGSSAVDLAHLLQERGASPRIIARAPKLHYNSARETNHETLLYRLQNPSTTIGRGWSSLFCAEAPLLFYRLPKHLKDRAVASHMHPAAGWFMREQVEGRVPTSLGRSLVRAETEKGRVALTLGTDSGEETVACDHVISATGYQVDLSRVPFLGNSLRSEIALSGNSPFVSDNFETTVPGLYTIGLATMQMFGPLLRFMVGAEFAAPRLAAHLERKTMRIASKRAA